MENSAPARPCELILALDVPDRAAATALLDRLEGEVAWIKVGLQLFTRHGPGLVEEVAGRGAKVFLDLKLHDIPNTVAAAIGSLAGLPVDLLTLHASGGRTMLEWAVRARDQACPRVRLLGVTVLTSLAARDLAEVGVPDAPEQQVERLGRLALEAGLDGLVCSPLELAGLRARHGDRPYLVTPGIRPPGSPADEQQRTLGPVEAVRAGASAIVVGRPILQAADPAAAARELRRLLEGASAHG